MQGKSSVPFGSPRTEQTQEETGQGKLAPVLKRAVSADVSVNYYRHMKHIWISRAGHVFVTTVLKEGVYFPKTVLTTTTKNLTMLN